MNWLISQKYEESKRGFRALMLTQKKVQYPRDLDFQYLKIMQLQSMGDGPRMNIEAVSILVQIIIYFVP